MNRSKKANPRGLFSTRDAARHAVKLALPLLEHARGTAEIGESGFLFVVILDPARPYGTCDFQDAVLYEHAVGDRTQWDADYAGFAYEKARVSWRTGKDGHAVRYQHPHLLHDTDTGLWGSVCLDGITVAVSGANPWFDEALATTIAAWFRAVVKGQALATPEVPANLPESATADTAHADQSSAVSAPSL